jgi:hypothetical protein
VLGALALRCGRTADGMHSAQLSPTIVKQAIERTGQPWPRVITGVAVVLLLLLIAACALDGVLLQPDVAGLTGLDLLPLIMILYMLVGYHLLIPPLTSAVNVFQALTGMDGDLFRRLVAEKSALSRRREWSFIAIGAVGGLLMGLRFWDGPAYAVWTRSYWLLSAAVTLGLLGWGTYASLSYAGMMAELHRQPVQLDIFNPRPLEPIAHWSLGLAMLFIGGITLSVLLIPDRQMLLNGEWITLYSLMLLVPILVFFLTLMSTHNLMADAKNRELELVRRGLADVFQELRDQRTKHHPADKQSLSQDIANWLAYEKRVEQAPEWPYSANTLRNLLMSTLVPVAAWVAQVVVELVR